MPIKIYFTKGKKFNVTSYYQKIWDRLSDLHFFVSTLQYFFLNKLDKVPPDLYSELADMGQATYLLREARLENLPYSELIQRSGQNAPMGFSHGISIYQSYLQRSGMVAPL